METDRFGNRERSDNIQTEPDKDESLEAWEAIANDCSNYPDILSNPSDQETEETIVKETIAAPNEKDAEEKKIQQITDALSKILAVTSKNTRDDSARALDIIQAHETTVQNLLDSLALQGANMPEIIDRVNKMLGAKLTLTVEKEGTLIHRIRLNNATLETVLDLRYLSQKGTDMYKQLEKALPTFIDGFANNDDREKFKTFLVELNKLPKTDVSWLVERLDQSFRERKADYRVEVKHTDNPGWFKELRLTGFTELHRPVRPRLRSWLVDSRGELVDEHN